MLFAAVLCVFFIVALIVSVARYQTYLDGFDYTVFVQTLWHYSEFSAPSSSVRDVNNILGDHFHPLLVVLTPLFWIWNNPAVLLFVQPLLFAISAVPLYLLAKRHFGRNSALCISVAYLASHGIQFALFFDFHEIALAVPLVSLLIYAIDREQYRIVAVSAVALCLIKEELILMVAMAGIILVVRNKQYKLGAAMFFAALAFLAVLTKVIMPAIAGQHRYYAYWTYDSYGANAVDMVKNIVMSPFRFIDKAWGDITGNTTKTQTAWTLILSSGFTVFLSWYALLALPDLAIRLLSERGTFYWSYWFHYGAILMPVIFFCFIDVLRKIQRYYSGRWLVVLPAALAVFNIGLMSDKNFPFAQIFNPELYSLHGQVRSGEQKVKDIVGPSSSITAPVVILPHFANRSEAYLLTDKGRWYTDENVVLTREPNSTYVIMNELLPITDVDPSYDYNDLQNDIKGVGYKQIYSDKPSGWIIYQK